VLPAHGPELLQLRRAASCGELLIGSVRSDLKWGQPVDSAGTQAEDWTVGYLTDVILTRDTWMHRSDIAAASGPQDTARPGRASRRKPAARDSVTALVLAIHAEADRPLGFDQVVKLSENRVTRTQVSTASAALCRDGQLDRIRSGLYQWSAGQHAAARQVPTPRRDTEPTGPSARQSGRISAAELFSQLFPSGVQMTGELLADLEQWARLTSKLATLNESRSPRRA
jgi:hypothetical protein